MGKSSLEVSAFTPDQIEYLKQQARKLSKSASQRRVSVSAGGKHTGDLLSMLYEYASLPGDQFLHKFHDSNEAVLTHSIGNEGETLLQVLREVYSL